MVAYGYDHEPTGKNGPEAPDWYKQELEVFQRRQLASASQWEIRWIPLDYMNPPSLPSSDIMLQEPWFKPNRSYLRSHLCFIWNSTWAIVYKWRLCLGLANQKLCKKKKQKMCCSDFPTALWSVLEVLVFMWMVGWCFYCRINAAVAVSLRVFEFNITVFICLNSRTRTWFNSFFPEV